MDNAEYYRQTNELIAKQVAFVSVILVDANGSIPPEIGVKMLVTECGLHYGTVGGGKVEKKAIEEAQALLSINNSRTTHFVNWSLSRDVGMTCGGQVKLYFETYNYNQWHVVVFGAGHVANALMQLLIKLECKVTCIDPRREWLDKLPDSPKLKKVHETDMPSLVKSIPTDAFVLLMSMGHTTDKPILLEILRQEKNFPYLGVIGSAAKAARLYKDIEEAGLPAHLRDSFHCPIGLDFGSNHPDEIAISVIAQLLQQRDLLRSTSKSENSCEASQLIG